MLKLKAFNSELDWIDSVSLADERPYYSTTLGAAFNADSMTIMEAMPSSSVDLVMTSPPFALVRKKEYGNEPVERYLDWFTPFCKQIHRILKPSGSFVLDLGGSWTPGSPVRSMYHFEVALNIAKDFKLAQEFYWYNPAKLPTPAEWVTIRRIRVKDAVNMIWWFSKDEYPKADNRNVLKPYSKSMKSLIKNGYKSKKRPSGHDISDKFQIDNGGAIPPNLIEIANTSSNDIYLRSCREKGLKPHPARYPEQLVKFFLDFVTDPGDLVFDPFGGSNATGAACEASGRRWLVSELEERYLKGSVFRFADSQIAKGSNSVSKTAKKKTQESNAKSKSK